MQWVNDTYEAVRTWSGLKEILIGTGAMFLAFTARKCWAWVRTPVQMSPRAASMLDYIEAEQTYQDAVSVNDGKGVETPDYYMDKTGIHRMGVNLFNTELFTRKEKGILKEAVKSLARDCWARSEKRKLRELAQDVEETIAPVVGAKRSFQNRG